MCFYNKPIMSGSTIKDASVVHRMHLDTSLGAASYSSARMTAFTAAGIADKIRITENRVPSIDSTSSSRRTM